MIFHNPEFKKNLWLEFSLARLVAAPAFLTAVFLLVYLLSEGEMKTYAPAMEKVCFTFFSIITLLWGTKQASESVAKEVNHSTWDAQRMTRLSPSEMAVGKLFGSTAYCWYAALWLVPPFLAFSGQLGKLAENVRFLAALVMAAVAAHAVSIIFSLVVIRRNQDAGKIRTSSLFILVMVVLLWGWMVVAVVSGSSGGFSEILKWWGFRISYLNYMLFLLAFYLFWAIVGLVRSMGREFSIENGPAAWIFFLLSQMLLYSGLCANSRLSGAGPRAGLGLAVCFFIAVFFAYVTVFFDTKDPADFRRLADFFRKKQWRPFLTALPLWAICLAAAFLVLVAAVGFKAFFQSFFPETPGWFEMTRPAGLFNLACFFVRDAALLFYFHFNPAGAKPGRSDMAAVFWLILLYALFPLILNALKADAFLHLFLPAVFLPPLSFPESILSLGPLVQAVIMAGLAVARFRAINRLVGAEMPGETARPFGEGAEKEM